MTTTKLQSSSFILLFAQKTEALNFPELIIVAHEKLDFKRISWTGCGWKDKKNPLQRASWTDAFWLMLQREPETRFSSPVWDSLLINLPLMLMYNGASCSRRVSFGWLILQAPGFSPTEWELVVSLKRHICKPNFPRQETLVPQVVVWSWTQPFTRYKLYLKGSGINPN